MHSCSDFWSHERVALKGGKVVRWHLGTTCDLCADCVWKGLVSPGRKAALTFWHQLVILSSSPFTRFLFLSISSYSKKYLSSPYYVPGCVLDVGQRRNTSHSLCPEETWSSQRESWQADVHRRGSSCEKDLEWECWARMGVSEHGSVLAGVHGLQERDYKRTGQTVGWDPITCQELGLSQRGYSSRAIRKHLLPAVPPWSLPWWSWAEDKPKLWQLFKGSQFAMCWGFIPLVICLGFKRHADPEMSKPSILSLLWW